MSYEYRKVTVQAAFGKNHLSTIGSGDWTDLSQWSREATWQFGRSNELDDFDTGTATITLLNRDRRFDPNNASSPYVGQLLPNVPVRIRSVTPVLDTPGTASNYMTTPDHSSLDITGDIDIRGETQLADWTPGVVATLVNKFNSAANQASYMVQVDTVGNLRMVWTTDGTLGTLQSHASTAPTVIPADGWLSWKVTLDVNVGGTTKEIKFYTSTVEPASEADWVQLGTTVSAAGVSSIFNSNAGLIVGGFNTGVTEPPDGRFRWIEVRNGINGTVVANPRFTAPKLGATSFVDATGKTWTIVGTAAIVLDDAQQDEFYGFVQSGWQQDLAPKGSDECRIELVDRLGVMAGVKLADIFHQAILDHNPVGFWVLDGGSGEGESAEVIDLGSGRNNGTTVGDGITLGDKPIIPGGDPAARFDVAVDPVTLESTYGAVEITRSRITTGSSGDPLVVITFLARSKASSSFRVLFTHSEGTGVTGYQAHIDTTGKLVYVNITNSGGIAYQVPDPVVGRVGLFETAGHIMFGCGDGIALDTPILGTPTTSSGLARKNGVAIGGGRGVEPADHMDGWIGSVAVFASHSTVGLAGRGEIFAAFDRLAGETTDVHISWALDQIGVPAGSRNLDTGTVILGPSDTGGKDALQFIQETAAAEGGGLYVDHRDGGKIRFTNRYARFLNARSINSQTTFSDDPAVSSNSVIRYPAEGLDLSPNGLDGVVNQVTARWQGGEVIVSDQPSIDAYGPRPREISTGASAAEARSAAEWMIARYKTPRSRIRGVTVGAKTFNRHESLGQRLRIDDRVTFRVHPLRVGTATTMSLFVDGVSHSARGVEWTTSFRFAPVDTFPLAVWGTGLWGTAAWG
jgi:hypothetical protein